MIDLFSVEVFPGVGEAIVKALSQEYRITIADLEACGITADSPVDEESLSFLSTAEEKLRCIKKAFVYLSYKGYSKRALGQKLKRASFSDVIVETVISLLENKGYLDDYNLCAEQAVALQKYKGFGVLRIKKELYAKGFDRDCIENALAELEETQEEQVTEILRKKFPCLNSEDRQARAKATAYLASRGYSYDEINNAICAFKEE